MTVIEAANGNPGALMCVLGLVKEANPIDGIKILMKIEELKITGTDLYVLFSDLCNKDYGLMAYLCSNVPNDVLKDASSRQDYSGRELVEKFVTEYGAMNFIANMRDKF